MKNDHARSVVDGAQRVVYDSAMAGEVGGTRNACTPSPKNHGLWYYQPCLVHTTQARTCDIPLDEELMTYLGGGALPVDREERQRVFHAAKLVKMKCGRVWMHNPKTGTK